LRLPEGPLPRNLGIDTAFRRRVAVEGHLQDTENK
jgi:hypothetical protein